MNNPKNQNPCWLEPVYVQVGMESPKVIHNEIEAVSFLDSNWQGSAERRSFAREICLAASIGHISIEAARQAFVDAVSATTMNLCAPRSHE